jgi:acetylornithine/succinyldiaminopimelate/putrescine aminotransferase
VVEGKKQYLFDENGRRYLDAFGGIATVCCGHCHPDVVAAIVEQTKKLQHSTVLYLNHAVADFAEALANKLPGDLKVRRYYLNCVMVYYFFYIFYVTSVATRYKIRGSDFNLSE